MNSRRRRGAMGAGLVLSLGLGLGACTNSDAPPKMPEPASHEIHEGCGPAAQAVSNVWTKYRDAHPFHSQEVAISEPLAGGCRVLILSEPPPDVSTETIRALNPALAGLTAQRHPLGVDGWTEDLAVLMPPTSDDDLADLTSDLHVALFGTAYRAELAPIIKASPWKGTLNVEARPAELHEWVFGSKATFWPVDGGPRRRASDLLTPNSTGVYASSTPGVVLWSMPKHGPFEAQRANVRMFGLESDLVLGAVASEDTVLVIGRERLAPVDVSPPLRFETVRILATSSAGQLAQSFERNQIFAGPLPDGPDWAPILLSPVLVDTELGSVLNIADQLLKRWSQNGTVRYEGFQYPDEPVKWAFAAPIQEVLGVSILQFNWNTNGSGGAVHLSGNRDLYWMSQTGALHVSYLPDEKVDSRTQSYEGQARAFFAERSDPYLVRVVQYTSLFQAFRKLGVTAEEPAEDLTVAIGADGATAVLEEEGTEMFRRLVAATDADVSSAAERFMEPELAKAFTSDVWRSKLAGALEAIPPQNRAKIEALLKAQVKSEVAASWTRGVRSLKSQLGAEKDPAVARHLAVALVHQPLIEAATRAPAEWNKLVNTIRSPAEREKAAEITAAATFLHEQGIQIPDARTRANVAVLFGHVDVVEKRYRAVRGARPVVSRIRTPSVVRSRGDNVVGGHNVGSEIPVARETIRPAELSRIRVEQKGLTLLPEPELPRPRPIALGGEAARPPALQPADAGGRQPPPRSPGGGWAPLFEEPSSPRGAHPLVAVTLFERSPGSNATAALRSRHRVEVNGSPFRAGSVHDIRESVARALTREAKDGKKSVKIDFVLRDRDVTVEEAHGIAQSVSTAFKRRALGEEGGYVIDRGKEHVALAAFDLGHPEVSAPERIGDGFAVSVTLKPKQGGGKAFVMRLLRKGEPAADASEQVKAAVSAGVRGPEEIARDLKARFAGDAVPLLELVGEAQPTIVENSPSAPRSRHAGTPGHTL